MIVIVRKRGRLRTCFKIVSADHALPPNRPRFEFGQKKRPAIV